MLLTSVRLSGDGIKRPKARSGRCSHAIVLGCNVENKLLAVIKDRAAKSCFQ